MSETNRKAFPAATDMIDWTWPDYEPHFLELAGRELTAAGVETWLADWTYVRDRAFEVYRRLSLAKDRNTADKEAEERYDRFSSDIYPKLLDAEQKLKTRLLESALAPAGFEQALRRLRVEAALFRQENLPLYVEELQLAKEYGQLVGKATVTWEGKETTLARLALVDQDADRGRREAAWRLGAERRLQDREAFNALWRKLLDVRLRIARNAGFPDYRAFRWKQMTRLDYNVDDCKRLDEAIAEVAVPAAARRLDRRRKALGFASLRPWDLGVDVEGRDPLRPFADIGELEAGAVRMLARVDSRLGRYLQTMVDEKLLDLDNRKNKAPGGYCTGFPAAKRPFIFMNAVGLHNDLKVLLHEGGHAVHAFEVSRLPYFQQRNYGLEFAEVASMSMELLTLPFLTAEQGGFYNHDEARRARTDQLEGILRLLPHIAVIDSLQQWAYENPEAAADPASMDRRFLALHERYQQGVDWSGLEEERSAFWQRQLHIFQTPFYYIEYGLAQLGACQVWANALRDRPTAVSAYLSALALGGTASLPELFRAAGVRLAFDAGTVREVVDLLETQLAE